MNYQHVKKIIAINRKKSPSLNQSGFLVRILNFKAFFPDIKRKPLPKTTTALYEIYDLSEHSVCLLEDDLRSERAGLIRDVDTLNGILWRFNTGSTVSDDIAVDLRFEEFIKMIVSENGESARSDQ